MEINPELATSRLACAGRLQGAGVFARRKGLVEPRVEGGLERRIARHPVGLVEVVERIRDRRGAQHARMAARLVVDLGAIGHHLLPDGAARIVIAGHGYGAIVAAWAARRLGQRCAGLVLVDGGWQDFAAETGMSPDEWLGELEEPPGIFSSMAAYLADRRDFDPPSWDADQDQAARTTVVEVPAGKVVPAIRPHALAASVEAMFTYRPLETLAEVTAPITAILAASEDPAGRSARLLELTAARRSSGLPGIRVIELADAGHNLMRYRPAEVSAAILDAAMEPIGG